MIASLTILRRKRLKIIVIWPDRVVAGSLNGQQKVDKCGIEIQPSTPSTRVLMHGIDFPVNFVNPVLHVHAFLHFPPLLHCFISSWNILIKQIFFFTNCRTPFMDFRNYTHLLIFVILCFGYIITCLIQNK